jgi:pyruvate formate lyase activating enzyme
MRFIPKDGTTRRAFIRDLAKWGAVAGISPMLLHVLTGESTDLFAQEGDKPVAKDDKYYDTEKHELKDLHPTDEKYYETIEDNALRCHICARHCFLPEGKTCFCRTHINKGGKLYATSFNKACIIQKDHVEVGPFHHFRPESIVMSLATAGCMLRCLYCQNWELSQALPSQARSMPIDAAEALKRMPILPGDGDPPDTIMFSYTEPVAFHEWAMAISERAIEHKIHRVCVSSGYWGPPALKDAIKMYEAFCITLKGFTEQFYVNVLGAHLKPVMDNLVTIRESGRWLEVPILLVPGYNDDMDLIKQQVTWIKDYLGEETPVHFARLEPKWKMANLPRTPQKTLEDAREVGLEAGLKFVYIANLPGHEGNSTFCPNCKKIVIQRLGFLTKGMYMNKAACKFCGAKLPGVWGDVVVAPKKPRMTNSASANGTSRPM